MIDFILHVHLLASLMGIKCEYWYDKCITEGKRINGSDKCTCMDSYVVDVNRFIQETTEVHVILKPSGIRLLNYFRNEKLTNDQASICCPLHQSELEKTAKKYKSHKMRECGVYVVMDSFDEAYEVIVQMMGQIE